MTLYCLAQREHCPVSVFLRREPEGGWWSVQSHGVLDEDVRAGVTLVDYEIQFQATPTGFCVVGKTWDPGETFWERRLGVTNALLRQIDELWAGFSAQHHLGDDPGGKSLAALGLSEVLGWADEAQAMQLAFVITRSLHVESARHLAGSSSGPSDVGLETQFSSGDPAELSRFARTRRRPTHVLDWTGTTPLLVPVP